MKSKVLRTHVRSDYSVETASKLKEYFIDDVNDGLRNLIKLRNAFGPNFNGIKRGLFSTLGLSNHYSDPTNVYNYLYYANQLNYAWFQFVMNDGKPITLQIANRTIETVGQFKNEGIGAANVIAGIQTALILRDQKALYFYAQIPLEFTGQANQQDMVVETMLLFYQVLIRGTGNQNEANSTYRELVNQLNWDEYQRYVVKDDFYSPSVWKIIHGYRTQEINYLLIPVLFVYHQILHQNQSGYEQAVYDALIKWKEYYTLSYVDENKEDRDHSIDPAGYLALPIAAACAYAYDKGMKLETVQSDYIPAWMVEGRFDEFNLLV